MILGFKPGNQFVSLFIIISSSHYKNIFHKYFYSNKRIKYYYISSRKINNKLVNLIFIKINVYLYL